MADKASARIIDMTNVKESGGTFNKKRVPEGDYLARVTKVEDAVSKKDGEFQWLFTIVLEKHQTAKYPYYCKLQENQLWKVRNLLVAAGINVPKKKLKLDPEKVVGKLIAVTMEDDEYEGKLQSNIGTIFPPSELEGASSDDDDVDDVDDDEEEEDEEPTPPPAKKKKAKPAPEPEPEEDDEDEDDEEDEEEPPPPPKKKAKKKAKAVSDEELDELDIEDV